MLLNGVVVDGEFGLTPLYDCGQHAEEVAVVDCPDLLQQEVPDPVHVLGVLHVSVGDDPLAIGVETPTLEVVAPL